MTSRKSLSAGKLLTRELLPARKWLLARKWFSAGLCLIGLMAAIALTSCKAGDNKPVSNQHSAISNQSETTAAQPGEAGIEKVKPAPGTGNVQGKVS